LTHDNRVCLSKIGAIKVKLHRTIKGTIKTCTIKREGDHWYVVFACEVERMPLPENHEAVGIDLGLLHFATLSTGETIENPRYYRKASKQLVNRYGTIVFEELQPANMSKRPKPKQDENGKYLPNGAAAKGGLNKSIVDAGWAMFQQFCLYKAANAGREVLFVTPNYTSQFCSGCGQVKKKDLSERWHSCECGCSLDRDHNAALNILRLGRSLQETRS